MQWPPTEPESTSSTPFASKMQQTAPPTGPRGFAAVAWLVIVLAVLIVMVMNMLPVPETEAAADDAGVTMMEFQAKSIVGVDRFGSSPSSYAQASVLNLGSVPQRLRFVVLAAQLAGTEKAMEVLDELESHIESPPRGDPPKLTPEQLELLAILRELYEPRDTPIEDRIAALNGDETALIADQLGWFGELLLTSGLPNDQPPRSDTLAPATRVIIVLIVVGIGALLAGFGGFIGLIVMLVLALTGRLRARMGSAQSHHGIYAETFAIWLVGFFIAQVIAALALDKLGAAALTLPVTVVLFFASLLVLAWPVFRGIPFRQVRRDIGWTLGDTPPLEAVLGVAGYAMALPLLALGLAMVILIMGVLTAAGPPLDTFAPTGAPMHPIALEIASGGIMIKLMILTLAAVAAPIVEETMFRGVLYRHLRDASRAMGLLGSIVVSAIVNSFIFAAIHPQGLIAVPALMALAIAFSLMREWRGTVIPCMLMHGISNALLIGLFMLAMS